jgi:hypothetical protein
MLEEISFSSCRMFCHPFQIGKATCLQILDEMLSLKKFHLRWVPHALLVNQKSETVSYSKFLLTALIEQKASGCQRIIARESRFSFYYSRDTV